MMFFLKNRVFDPSSALCRRGRDQSRPYKVWLLMVLAVFGLAIAFAAPLEVRSGLLTVRYHDPQDRVQLEFVFRAWRRAVRELQVLGFRPQSTVLESFAGANAFARATGEPWFVAASTQGRLIRTQRLSALRLRGSLELTVRHEAFHTVQPAHLPRWLAEGLARHFSGEGARDSRAATGLESLTEVQLDEALLGRTGRVKLELAYREATRRARALVQAKGWQAVLAPPATRKSP